jgi:hypothetical protein
MCPQPKGKWVVDIPHPEKKKNQNTSSEKRKTKGK